MLLPKTILICFLFGGILHSCNSISSNSKELSETDSLKLDSLLFLSEQLSAGNNYDSSIIVCNEILEMDKNNPFALLRRAYAYRMSNKFEESLEDFNLILSADPYNKYALLNIGVISYQDSSYNESINAFTKIINGVNLFPDSMYLEQAFYFHTKNS